MVWFRLAAIIFIAATVTGGSGQAWAQRRFGRHVLIPPYFLEPHYPHRIRPPAAPPLEEPYPYNDEIIVPRGGAAVGPSPSLPGGMMITVTKILSDRPEAVSEPSQAQGATEGATQGSNSRQDAGQGHRPPQAGRRKTGELLAAALASARRDRRDFDPLRLQPPGQRPGRAADHLCQGGAGLVRRCGATVDRRGDQDLHALAFRRLHGGKHARLSPVRAFHRPAPPKGG